LRHKPTLLILLTGLILWLPVQANILDEEEHLKPVATPKPQEKKPMILENERINNELQTVKTKQQQADKSVKIDMVQLPTGILIGKYEVTQGQWQTVMGVITDPSKFTSCGVNCPVEQVSWDDVQAFIKKLNSQTGKHYRLPTEDEWQSACHAGYKSEYCGSNNIAAVAWYEGNSGGTTHAVGQKQPNGWGLYDMSGNVWEWTSGCREGDCPRRVSRGGSYFDTPAGVRSVYRFRDGSSSRNSSLGFRLAEDR